MTEAFAYFESTDGKEFFTAQLFGRSTFQEGVYGKDKYDELVAAGWTPMGKDDLEVTFQIPVYWDPAQ